jgi:hypothetical protein
MPDVPTRSTSPVRPIREGSCTPDTLCALRAAARTVERYAGSEKALAKQARYDVSDKGRAAKARYARSDKGRAAQER